MSLPFPEHPLRHALTAELHVRNFDPLRTPARVLGLAYLCGRRGTGRQVEHLRRLLAHYGQSLPEDPGLKFSADIGDLCMRWERHTEFITLSLTQPLSPSYPDDLDAPFSTNPIDLLPAEWLRTIPGQVVSSVLLVIESADMPEREPEALRTLFDGHPVIGAEVAGGAGKVFADMRIHADGYGHILVRDQGLSDGQAGRLVRRVLELNAYRAMALLGLPEAREAGAVLADADARLAEVAAALNARDEGGMASDQGLANERSLLAELTALAAEIETVAARTTSRFDATEAYYAVIRQRLEQLRQTRIQGLQTFTEFLDARLAPSVATCTAVKERQENLAARAARLTGLLRARVEIGLQEQNRKLLDSMDRRARLQLRLQETVEGLSVIAISYYGVGLIGYLLKGLDAGGLAIDTGLALGIAAPLVVAAAWLGLHRVKHGIKQGAGDNAEQD